MVRKNKMALFNQDKEFNHVQYFPLIERMYEQSSVEEMRAHASFSQLERFRKELETLNRFGLHKRLEIRLKEAPGDDFAASKSSDGKVDMIYSVSNASIHESYLKHENKLCHRRHIKHAFVSSTAIKSNRSLRYNANNPPQCLNCAAPLEAQGDKYHCEYCGTYYDAEAYHYLLARFFIHPIFKKWRRYVWPVFLLILLIVGIEHAGLMELQKWEKLTISASYLVGAILLILFFVALTIGLVKRHKEKAILSRIHRHDPHFSKEILTARANELLGMHPELLIKENHRGQGKQGVICRSIQTLQLSKYEREGNWECLEMNGKADVLFLHGSNQKVRLKDQELSFTLHLGRLYGTLTPVHAIAEQFSCQSCGSHEMIEDEGVQVCTYCQADRPMESIDWVLLSPDDH